MCEENWTTSRMYCHARAQRLDYPHDPITRLDRGIYPSSLLRVGYGWGTVSEAECPYLWPPNVPECLDALALANRTGPYSRVRTLLDCKMSLVYGPGAIASFPLTSEWNSPRGGRIKYRDAKMPRRGNHAVVIVGYNDKRKLLTIMNSWGEAWGDKGFG